MYSDYHIHSLFSFDSDETLENIVETAIQLGMKQIAITDHQDFNWPIAGENPTFDVIDYSSAIDTLRNNYQSKIQILKGVEFGLMTDSKSICQDFLNQSDFDFVIGSCHIVDNKDPYYPDFWEMRNDREAFELYFTTLLDGLKSFYQIDTVGHLDYVVRYSPNKDANYSVNDYRDIIDEILKFIISKDIKLEINTASLAKGFSFPNPHTDIIQRYTELGGRYVTIGSDAHKAHNIGYGFEQVSRIVEKYGLKVYCK